MAVDIRKWGPAAWDFMYATTFAYPENPTPEDEQGAIQFFRGLQHMLPCKDCCHHFKAHMEKYPIEYNVNSRSKLCTWLLNLNNSVNERTGKQPLRIEEVWDRLVENGPEKRRRYRASLVCVAIILALLLLVLLFLLWRRRRT